MIDHYVYPGTNVLRNKFNVKDGCLLNDLEHHYTMVEMHRIYHEGIIGKFDVKHLQLIHKRLFGDVYDWAGEFRDIQIWKGGTEFVAPEMISQELSKLFTNIRRARYLKGLSERDTAYNLADVMCRLNNIHPFREGNGRCQRLFMEQMAMNVGYNLDFSNISENDMRDASRAASRGDNRLMRYLFDSNMQAVEVVKKTGLSKFFSSKFSGEEFLSYDENSGVDDEFDL